VTPALPTYTLAEWQTLLLPAYLTLTAEDRLLAASLVGGEAGRLEVDELREGIRIRARSWVGMIRFQNFEVCITPKLAGGNTGLVQMLTLTGGLNALRRNRGQRTLAAAESIHLFDLLALLFVEACERILQGGLLHDYVEREADLSVLRGRLLVGQQVRRHYGRVDRLACRYDDHLTNIAENQIIAAALTVCRSRVSRPEIRLHIHRLHTIFAAACEAETPTDLKSVRTDMQYHRMNEHYREAHELAWLLLDGLGIEDLLAAGRTRSFAFLLDMNRLFEAFIVCFVEHALAQDDYQVQPQKRDRSVIWDLLRERPYTHITPDILLQAENGRRLAVDAKYKLYDERPLSTADIYQSFLYAYAYSDINRQIPAALLLYPASKPGKRPVHLQIRGREQAIKADLHTMAISIPQAIAEINDSVIGPVSKALLTTVTQFVEGDTV
jgi:5-methylcytosine-specific restriction enzyme subunit McrC